MKKKFILLAATALLLAGCTKTPAGSTPAESTPTPDTSVETSVPEEELSVDSNEVISIPNGDAAQKLINLSSNHEGEEVSILDPNVQQYVDAMYAAEEKEGLSEEEKYKFRDNTCPGVQVTTYQGKKPDNVRDYFNPVVVTFDATGVDASTYDVYLSTNEDMSNPCKHVRVSTTSASFSNLFCDTTYYWQVFAKNGTVASPVGSFHTKGSFRNITAQPAYNVRDFGGKMTSSGRRTKQGVIYRGGELTPDAFGNPMWGSPVPGVNTHIVTLDDDNKGIFYDELKIRVELDVRNGGNETNNQTKSYIGDDVTYQLEPNIGSLTSVYNVNPNSSDGAEKITKIKRVFATFANATEDAAVYFHCWGGADRTGTFMFLLDGLLGVSYTECLMDYEFTSFDNVHTRRRDATVRDEANNEYKFPDFLNAIKNSSYYSANKSFSEIIESWMRGRLGMTDAEISALKDNLLED